MASPREKVLEDCLDFVGRRVVFSDGLLRLQYFQQFEELYVQQNSLSTVSYGRLYNLSEITEFLVILTQAARAKNEEPYTIDAPPGKNLIPRTVPFDRWKPADWKSFRESLVKIQTSMLRRDAKASIDDIFRNEGENKEIDPSRSHDPWFTDKLFKVLDLFKLHEKLAPFREDLEIQSSMSSDEDEALMPLSLPKKLLNDFIDMVEKEGEKRIKKVFLSLLKNDQSDTFQSPTTIRRLLDDPTQPHSFAFFLNRTNKLMRAWASQVLDSATTTNTSLPPEASIKVETGQARALKKLQRSRAILNQHVEDPLEETVIAAEKAKPIRKRKHQEAIPSEDKIVNNKESEDDASTGDRAFSGRTKTVKKKRFTSPRGRGTMLEKKKSATRLNFTPEKESDSEEIEDPKEEDEVLPDVKRRAKRMSTSPQRKLKSQEKMYEGRRVWSDAEKSAVIQGLGRFGVGKWAEIKKEYFLTLKFRTSGQIKDCYRTLKKRGELGDFEKKSPEKKVASEGEKEEQEKKGEQEEEQEPAEEEKEENVEDSNKE